jgi:putative ATPase
MTTVHAARGDITAMDVDAVVNAANEALVHGGGLAAAIVRAGGEVVQEESDRWVERHGRVTPGRAAVTTAGAMPAEVVVHVAGPVYLADQDNEGLLRTAVAAALDAAAAAGCRSVAVPAISAGIYGYPPEEATAVIAAEALAWAGTHPGALDEIRLVGFDSETVQLFCDGIAAAEGS